MKVNRFLLLVLLISVKSFGADSSNYVFKYSKVISIPDLTFLDDIYTGLDILEQMDFEPLKGKKIAILSNHTAINRNGRHLLDLLKATKDIKVSFLLALEHGVWGIDDKRSKMIGRDQIDPVHGAPIIDLFNTYLYPPHWVMEEIDLILVDFQDTGSRYSTNIATMSKVFESASNHKVPILLLDRPNPIRGDIVDGPIPRTEFQSFESYHLLPIRHGLTIGEMALMINEMGWTKDSKRVELSILPLSNWNRDMWFNNTRLPWRNPNPYITDENNLLAFSGMDLFRGTNMNLGFGTKKPYMIVGAPWLVTSFLLEKLNDQGLTGVEFKEVKYRPIGSGDYLRVPKYDGQSCSGIEVVVKDRAQFKPLSTATTLMLLIQRLHPREFQWEEGDYIDKLFGTKDLRIVAAQKKPPDHLPALWAKDIYEFNDFRQSYLIYK
tara:strand:- start:668 stop:1975 length:1308 start_codon:yes stop_codon:yes gene_type:complete